MKEFTYVITAPDGLHARPAGLLVKEAQRFKSNIQLKKKNLSADAKKIFSVMKLAAKQNDSITVTCNGEDELEAQQALESLFRTYL